MVEVMAASSGGVDWSLVLKPFLSPNYESSNTTELVELCSTIVKSESEIWRHKETYKNFYNTFTVLAADYISSSISKLSGTQLVTASAACRVLLQYLLNALQNAGSEQYQDSAAIERYLNAIRVLCVGTGLLSTTEVSSLVDTMKGENLPQQPNVSHSGNDKDVSIKQESSKNRPDLSAAIFERLTLPIREGPHANAADQAISLQLLAETGETDPISEIHRLFLRTNTENLQSLKAGDTLIDLCLNLPTIKKSKLKVEEALAGRPFSIPSNHAEALAFRNSLPQTVSELTLAISAIHLPVLEPLNPTKLEKLCSLAMAALYCAMAQSSASACLATPSVVSPKCGGQQGQTANLKEEDLDSNAVKLVEEALNMYSYIGSVIKTSSRAGGHVYQNYILAGAWVLISGLQTHLTQTTSGFSADKSSSRDREQTEKGRPSPSKQSQNREAVGSSMGSGGPARSGLQKFQQSFGILSVALATRALALLSELFDDLNLEVCVGPAGSLATVEPAPLAMMGQFTALQRVARVLSAAPLNHLLFYLSIVSYRKACSLKRFIPPEGDNFSQSDSTAYFEDMILCSDENSETDEDDDSEPLLGQWFEETLVPPEPSEAKSPSASDNSDLKSNQSNRGRSVVPEKGEVDGYISLATNIFVFMNKHFLCSKSTLIGRYIKNGLTEQQMIILAAIIRDLDREWSKSDFSEPYGEFSNSLMKFTHNLITSNNLTPLQACLLNHLGVSPWNADTPHGWPLQVFPRTLTVLTQVLLLRSQNEKEASVISIWHRLVNTLIENVLNAPQGSEMEIEDLNVEHAEVLLYLFHSLNLMQKKSVVLLMAGGVLRCSEVARNNLKDSQLLNLSRLLLLFDYIMKHLYDVPLPLLEKIQKSLFGLTNLANDFKDLGSPKPDAFWRDIEDPYRKFSNENHPSPKFYMLSIMETSNQESPKLDGLACNFILGTPDKLRYPLLLDALIEILNITQGISSSGIPKMSILGLCATQYCFTICWKLLLLLPPSIPYLERLATGEVLPPGSLMLHSLIWGARAGHKTFNRWLKDCLVKQGMFTQNTDKLLKSVTDAVHNLEYVANITKSCIISLTPDVGRGMLTKDAMPPVWQLMLLDSLIAKLEVSLEDILDGETPSISASEHSCVQELFPHVLKLTQELLHCVKWSLFHLEVDLNESLEKIELKDLEPMDDVLAICSADNNLLNTISTEIETYLPAHLNSTVHDWRNGYLDDAFYSQFCNDIIPSDSYIIRIVDVHLSSLSKNAAFSIDLSLKRTLENLTKFIVQHAPKIENTDTKNKAIDVLMSVTTDARTEFLYNTAIKALDKMIGDNETDERLKRFYIRVLHHSYNILMQYTSMTADQKTMVDENILHCCLKFYEKIIEKSSGRQALETFFTGEKHLVKVLMSVSNPRMSQQYSTRVLHFFNKLFQAAEKSSTDPSLNYLCSSMSKLAEVESEKLQMWLRQIILGPSETDQVQSGPVLDLKKQSANSSADGKELYVTMGTHDDKKSLVQENSQLLKALTSYIVKQTSNVAENVSITILKAIIPLGSHILGPSLEGVGFTELMDVMTMLADAGLGRGHTYLFPAVAEWIEQCVKYIQNKDISEKIINSPDTLRNSNMLQAASCILDYLSDVVLSITEQPPRSVSPQWEHESPLDLEIDWQEDVNDDDDSGEDSDEDSLCNKLCTFTVTQKEFMNQHWYHCHTCKMLDGVGVCSICARVCHKGHDISYAKYGNFFCDCGAKEDGSCQALVKRSPTSNTDSGSNSQKKEDNGEHVLASSLRRRTSSPIPMDKILFDEKRGERERKKLEESKEFLLNNLSSNNMGSSLLEFLQCLIPAIEATCNQNSPVGCHVRGVKALEQLHKSEKKYIHTDHLMVPTLGSQEGAFENVRMSYAGDQGQTIRQLFSAHIIRRVAMCCMTSTQGKRQHLAVSHEKGKITVLQLSALLKQADSATRKLTLTRLSSAPIPFTVLSMTSNLCNEDFLAVCGLKDCHVLTFNSNGQVTDHLVLHPQLETGNFIIKALWLPGSQTRLALVTADFVKIFDLSQDAANPQYHFLVPSGKIRDCTFMYEEGIYHMLLMSSPGHIYTEVLNDDSSTKFGSFYVTNTLEVFHLDITDLNGQIAGGGVSIYYSHTLMLLFYSYAQGKSFISPIIPKSNCLSLVFPINLPTTAPTNGSNSKSNSTRSPTPQPLCQWTEIPNHPGLICCAMQSSNQPVVLMLKPDSIMIQEIKVVPAKSKIMDMVAIRHSSGSELRTTLILLCEDGSLKMFIANMEHTGFWMSGSIQPTVPMGNSLKSKKKKPLKSGKTSSTPIFPVDFFEYCTAMNDVEFGGNDLLQIYNAAQLKHRLNTNSLYVVCNKPQFQIEVTNNDPNMVICGIRVLVGTQDPQKAPTYVEVFGRVISFSVTRSRWYDVPFSREESLQADKKLTIVFGPCQDPELMTMIDSIKVYGKTKDLFGWPEDNDDNAASAAGNTAGSSNNNQGTSTNNEDQQSGSTHSLSKLERLAMDIFKSLDASLYIYSSEERFTKLKAPALQIATKLLTLPTPPSIQVHSKALMLTLHPTKQQYHSYKDQALLEHVLIDLTAMAEKKGAESVDLDAESYYRLVLIVRGIAVSRPQNLVKFADSHASIQDIIVEDPLDNPEESKETAATMESKKSKHLLIQLMDVLWMLHKLNPEIPALAPVVVPGLKYTEQVIHSLVEIIHAFHSSENYSNITLSLYLQLLLCPDPVIAFSSKQALCKVLKPRVKRRRVYIPSPARCESPQPSTVKSTSSDQTQPSTSSATNHNEPSSQQVALPTGQFDVDMVEAIGLLEQGAHQEGGGINPLEALLGGGVGFPPLLDIPADADDETIVELAIALSLQDHEMGGAAGHDQHQVLQNLQAQLRGAAQGQVAAVAAQQEAANFSDTTASAAGSDDEGSTAATDGSTLRTSPAEQGGSAGSESGGSGVDSITGEHNVSGRSSAYGDDGIAIRTAESSSGIPTQANSGVVQRPSQGSDTLGQVQEDLECENENSTKLHSLRLQLLEKLIEYLPRLKNANGVRTLPLLQVISQLTADLDGTCERDRVCLASLLSAINEELQFKGEDIQSICTRSKTGEVHLLLLKLISNLLQRNKSTSKSGSSSETSNYVARTGASYFQKAGIITFCLKICQNLLTEYWKNQTEEDTNAGSSNGNLLKPHLNYPLPDMTPFFLKNHLKENSTDVFANYPHLITEIILRLPYQVQRLSDNSDNITVTFDGQWYKYLCEYMMTSLPPASRRNARKLLLYICGNKEKYRQLRDLHALSTHTKGVRQCCVKGGYQTNTDLQHSLSLPYDSLVELVEHLKACLDIALFRTGNWQKFCLHTEDILPFLLRVSFLLDDGVAPTILQLLTSALVINSNQQSKKSESSSKTSRKDREKSDDSAVEALFEESNCVALVEQINKQVSREVLARFIKTFTLENNTTTVRWQAHGLVLAIYKNSKPKEQEALLELLWHLWPLLPAYGKKAAQFVDLLGYFSLKYTEKKEGEQKIDEYVQKAVSVLRTQNEMLAHHPNANLYAHMSQFVELDGYYLESEPCLAVVEIKNKPALWHKAKKVTLQSGQTEVKIEFPLPIVACNLMIEYADFYENLQASSETLQCPRCSASVPANPGVCANCGENVFQCHKCRAINYDEKDPFLCHACGFCKYAKFDFSLQAKPCCAVEPIENDEDRKKTVSSINTLLEKADRIYKQLIANKPTLESLVLKITEHISDKKPDEQPTNSSNSTQNSVSTVQMAQVKVNKTIQMLAQQYCTECKTSFEELSKIIQKVLASRKELVTYERKHHDTDLSESVSVFNDLQISSKAPCVTNKCYGCATAATEHCLTLLRALALNKTTRQTLCSYGLVQELVWNNLRKGNVSNQEDVRLLLCTLTRDNPEATEDLCNLLMKRITNCLNGNLNSTDLGASIRHEIALLAAMVQKEDECWELKLSCMMSLFLKACEDAKSPIVMESVILPCLKIIQSLMKIPDPARDQPTASTGSKKSKDKSNTPKNVVLAKLTSLQAPVEVRKFLNKDIIHSFSGWKTRLVRRTETTSPSSSATKEDIHNLYLTEKYVRKWRRHVKKLNSNKGLVLNATSWMETVLFNSSSRQARTVACSIIEAMCTTYENKKEIISLLTCFLSKLSEAGESSAEFLNLYQSLIQETPWKQYLTIKGLPLVLANLMTHEIDQLHRLEATTLTSDLAQGYALNQLTELLAGFLDDSSIRGQYKSRLVGAILNGYLSLRRLVVQRTRLIDETQEKLLELLEEMTTGTEEETKAFMSVCIKTVERYSLQDILTPVFIFERLCSIIYPEENDIGEFFLTLEKDPQQEDFLQGRMLGNPYSSNEAGLGPLMRDVKNKICQDCELVALLEDDNGMELLVNNKIMSLDLPVKDVYKKIWLAEGDHDAMRVVYRMRGLLGDATEEFIETLDNKGQNAVDNEEVYKMANVLADCGGLKVMVTRLGAIQNVWRAKPLLQVLLKLFRLSIKVNKCQEVLIDPELRAMEVFLKILKLCLESDTDSSQSTVTEQLLDIMETLMSKATSKPFSTFEKLSITFGGPEYVKSLLAFTVHPSVKNNSSVLSHLTRILAALVYGNKDKMEILLNHFKNILEFNRYDFEHTTEDQQKLELFFKDALEYITMHAPCVKPTLLRTDSDELKDFISKPALKYILRFLTGLAYSHENTQLEISKADTIPIIHRLEQVSSDEHVGSLAENLLEALCTNPVVAKQIEEVREFTRSEKKRLAMAMREKQLGQLGMRTNDKGQVTAKSTILQQIEELGEESGLVCCICREGYKYQPVKVLGIYTFTKRCNVEEFETKQRKTIGYSTVTHFNVVHIDCHMSAVRLARARDEWESAALQNANTKCNGLLPLWGPQVPESAFASCLARHNTYLQESTNHRDIGHSSTIHDLKLLLSRFAHEKSFHEDTGGGGPQSNMHMVPYLIHVGLYVINTTRVYSREFSTLTSYTTTDISADLAYQSEGPQYMAAMALYLKSRGEWEKERLAHLSRLIAIAQARHVQPGGASSGLGDKSVKNYTVYKPYLIFYGLVDGIYKYFFKDVEGEFEQWPNNLADYIRHNDEALMKNSEKLLNYYTDELLPCTSFGEFCDVVGLLDVIQDTDNYISSVLSSLK
ncbi:hypothetical protein GWI33_006135 [Rhynchophorus ferrugineus]|uniref:UBR-type domain-containing protein n=1 Tax=Rhynchophorus ferrugineus TaxID=354439 RepID=A0A834ME12_RHYFE|nr:hypothetical protein GWI33_006135 [Rhynchophorus ferrugineus]